MHHRKFKSIPGLYPLDARGTPPVLETKVVLELSPNAPGGVILLLGRTTDLDH